MMVSPVRLSDITVDHVTVGTGGRMLGQKGAENSSRSITATNLNIYGITESAKDGSFT
jgi:hypothetical protein